VSAFSSVGYQESDLNIFHKFSPDIQDFSEVSEVTEELICRRAGVRRRRGNWRARFRLEKTFQNILVRFQPIPGLPGRENPGRQDASRNGLGLEGGGVKAEILKI